ncbi:hypothetical protein AOQ84DRAFT_357107 [Glonium stellatum]|uniref:TOM core complex subunit Tom6 n=1 Tax=Glonium stellatum TaxID=574774 RepID=A0A8E2ERI2_9PEZI|nr:hypothetical protein AOQ84DRAFT_357107 [Glonium stellatum]
MPSRQVIRGKAEEPSYVRSAVGAIASPSNRSVMTAVVLFAAGVAFLHSSWSEILIPL